MAFLASEAFDLRHGHPFDANLCKRFFDMLHFEGFNDGFDFLHDMRVVIDCLGIASMENRRAGGGWQS